MAEKNIDKILLNRLGNYEDPIYDRENWVRLARTLTLVSKPSNRISTRIKSLFLPAFLLLFISNLLLSGLLIKNNSKIETLLDKFEAEKQEEKNVITDTLNSLHSTSNINAVESTKKLVPESSPKVDELTIGTNNQVLLIRNPIPVNKTNDPLGKGESLSNIHLTDNPRSEPDEVSLANVYGKVENQTVAVEVQADEALQVTNIKNDKVNSPKDLAEKKFLFPKEAFKPGFFIGLPRISTDKSKTVPGYTLGVDLEFQLADQLNLHTAISYLPLSYKIDDHDLPEAINQLIKDYPHISEDQSIRSLHEVMSTSQTFEIPLGIRYDLKVLNNSRVFVEGGIYGRWFLNQNFEYEFTKGETRLIRNMKFRDPSFSFGGFYAAFGNKIRLRKNIGEIEVFLKRDWKPQGLEGRIYSIWGLKGSYRLHP